MTVIRRRDQETAMGFLIRIGFWLGLVLILIPRPGESGADATAEVGPLQILNTTATIFGDFAGLCERQPEVCDSAGEIMRSLGLRARDGAAIAYSAITSAANGDEERDEDSDLATGSVTAHALDQE